jgi:phage terminase small subunit
MPTPKKSYAQHMLSGNPSNLSRAELARRAASESATETTVSAGRPRLPKTLSELEAECWKDAAKIMRARGTLTKGDSETLELWAVTKASWILARRDIEKEGQKITETRFSKSGDEYQVTIINPSVKIARDALQQLLSLAAKMGLHVLDRTKAKKARGAITKRDLPPNSLGAMFPNMFKKGEKVC